MTRFVEKHAGALQLAFVVGVVGCALLLSVSLRPDTGGPAPEPHADDVTVTVMTPVATSYRPTVRLNGAVQARTVTSIIPQVSGRVVEVASGFRPGATVGKGDTLFAIDASDYELAVERTLAEIEIARSDLARLEAEAEAERKIWQGQFPDRPIPDLIARVPQIAAVKARIHSGEAARRTAELALRRTVVRAPFDARILETRLDVGQVVGGNAAVGTMFSIDSLEIAVSVSAAERRLIGPVVGQRVTVTTPGGEPAALDGRLVRAAAALDERTRLGTLFVTTDSKDSLTVGEFVTVEIGGIDTPETYRLPAAALTSRDQLWVVDEGRLAERTVAVLGREGDMAVVSIFDPAAGVVTLPPANGRDGMPVAVRGPGELAAAGNAAE